MLHIELPSEAETFKERNSGNGRFSYSGITDPQISKLELRLRPKGPLSHMQTGSHQIAVFR